MMSFIFQAGGALPANHKTYIERRQADYNALRAARNNQFLNVIAPRQMGKSSWYTQLGKIWADHLTPGFSPILTNQIEMSNYLVHHALTWPCNQRNVLLILDEVESVLSIQNDDKFFSETFFMTLRSLFNERRSYSSALVVALAGAISPGELVKNPAISPFNVGEKITLADFTSAETKMLTNLLSEFGIPVDASVHQAFFDWSNGHPYLLQRLCFELEKNISSDHLTRLTTDDVARVVDGTFLNQRNPLLWDNNLEHVHDRLHNLSDMAETLWQRIQSKEAVKVAQTNRQAYLELYLTGAIKDEAGRILIRNRIYEGVFLTKDNAGEDRILQPPLSSKPVRTHAFIAYSHKDAKYLAELHTHLAHYMRAGTVEVWDDSRIRPGSDWRKEIGGAIQSTRVAVLLISANFLASDFIADNELPPLLEAAKQEGATILCVILRACAFQDTELARFQTVNTPSKPLGSMRLEKRDEVWAQIAKLIKEALTTQK
jgi:AAA-like domain/TIR domain